MLKKIAETIRENKKLIVKKEIYPIVNFIDANSYKNSRIFSSIGEDSAAIKNGDKYILMTTDRIKTSFINNNPFGAGFSSILVSVDDIYACGGFPIAASIILSYKDDIIGKQIMEGICEGSKKFKVPVIRGHTNLGGENELSSTIIGEIKKDNYISACGAKVNDKIILAVDFNGKIGKTNKYIYDTTTFKSSERILYKRESMNIIAKKKIVNASKDISNGGIFGTLIQLIKFSGLGAEIYIDNIEIPPILIELNYDLNMFSKMYLTTSFILTAPEEKCKTIIEVFKDHGMKAHIIGNITKNKEILRIYNKKGVMETISF